jgi:hypothetical protein
MLHENAFLEKFLSDDLLVTISACRKRMQENRAIVPCSSFMRLLKPADSSDYTKGGEWITAVPGQ